MLNHMRCCLGLALAACVAFHAGAMSLWYEAPAEEWLEALPIGNGGMGAMVFGGVEHERIQFNEDTLWTGQPHDYAHEGAAEYLEEIRELLWAGEQAEAEALAMEHFMSQPLRQQAYQPFGDLHLHFEGHDNPEEYRRELDLEHALATTRYRIGETAFTRTVFASYPDGVIAVRIEADEPGAVSFTAELSSPHAEPEDWAEVETAAVDEKTLALRGQLLGSFNEMDSALRFESRLRADAEGGEVTAEDDGITVTNADAVTLLLTAATSYVDFADISGDPGARCAETLDSIGERSYEALKERHVADHSALFQANTIDLGGGSYDYLPADERLEAYQAEADPAVAALVYQFGRYLLIASSRPGSQPANLQGVWNDDLEPAWESKYTININTEMNYWLAELTGLSECHDPLFDALDDLTITGASVAETHYDAPGWVTHHNFDLWRGAAPINNANHGIWPTGGAWLCQHLWWRYQFTRDEDFLRQRAYPIMKEASRFFLDYLVEDPEFGDGWLVSGPSNSPERGGLVMGPAMDHQIIRYLFETTAKAAAILDIDADFREELETTAERIAPDQIGSHGQLQEWLYTEDPDSRHRHISHLWALQPGNAITPATPSLFEASRKSLEMRGAGEGAFGTGGWSVAWKANFWARFLDGEEAHRFLRLFMHPAVDSSGLCPNYFNAYPPFQIDGNFGAVSAMVEMLLQSHRPYDEPEDELLVHRIHLLPALPSAWDSGEVTGLRARGGFEVDMKWEDGQLSEASLRSTEGTTAVIEYEDALVVEADGEPVETERPQPGLTVFPTARGTAYVLTVTGISQGELD